MTKKSNFSIRRLIYNDKYLIIVSLILAVIIWIGASLNVGTAESKTIKITTPITLGDEVSEQLGMQYYTLQDSIDIRVTISGAKYVIGQVTENDLSVTFDTSTVNRTGVQNIPILVTNTSRSLDFEVTGTYPSTVEGFFDVNASKVMNVDLDFDESKAADGYVFGTPVLSEDKIVVSGPKTYIDRVEGAKISIDMSEQENLTSMLKDTCNIEFVGNEIEQSYFTITPRNDTTTPIKNISVTIPVLKQTKLPVSVDFVDKPVALSDAVMSVRYSVNEVEAGVLESADISSAVIGSINFNTIGVGKQKVDFDVTKLNGIKVLDNTTSISATVTISSAYKQKSVYVDKSKIEIEGVPDGYTAVVKSIDSRLINVIAPQGSTLTGSDMTLKCDVSEKKSNNTYPISITLNSDNSWIYGTYNATIELKENA